MSVKKFFHNLFVLLFEFDADKHIHDHRALQHMREFKRAEEIERGLYEGRFISFNTTERKKAHENVKKMLDDQDFDHNCDRLTKE